MSYTCQTSDISKQLLVIYTCQTADISKQLLVIYTCQTSDISKQLLVIYTCQTVISANSCLLYIPVTPPISANSCLFHGCLASHRQAKCISGREVARRHDALPHWQRSCKSGLLSHPLAVYFYRADQFYIGPITPGRVATRLPTFKSQVLLLRDNHEDGMWLPP